MPSTRRAVSTGHLCRVAYCGRQRVGYGPYCNRHKSHKRRHGDPLQTPITKRHLAPYIDEMADLIRRNPDSETWRIMEVRWDAFVEHAKRRGSNAGPMNHMERLACREFTRLAENVDHFTVIKTFCAIHFLREADPRLFRSDESFNFQMVRRVRGLSDVNAAQYWDPKTQKVKRVYRDLRPDVVAHFAILVNALFGKLAVVLIHNRKEEREQERQEEERLNASMRALR